jgi:hypothetical protein
VQALAQDGDCTSNIIYLLTQSDVDNFQADYGPCTRVNNELYIEDYTDSVYDITDLAPLSGLEEVGGTLTIQGNPGLTSLTGLHNLVSVGVSLTIWGNNGLANLEGLSGLISVSSVLEIGGNLGMQDFSGLSSLQSVGILSITDNPFLENLTGFPASLTAVRSLRIQDHFELVSLDGLPAITNLEEIQLEYNDVLNDLSALANSTIATANPEDTSIQINFNFGLTDLQGLPVVVKLGSLDVNSNPNLTSLAGLDALEEMWGSVWVTENQSLSDCAILTTVLDAVDDGDPGPGTGIDPNDPPDTLGLDYLHIADNLSGCNSIEEILADSGDVIHADGFEGS